MDSPQDLREVLEETARIIVETSNDPVEWGEWVVYFLAALETRAGEQNSKQLERFEIMLERLRDNLIHRKEGGSWWLLGA